MIYHNIYCTYLDIMVWKVACFGGIAIFELSVDMFVLDLFVL